MPAPPAPIWPTRLPLPVSSSLRPRAVGLIGASLTGVAAIGTGGALGLLSPDQTPSPAIIEPSPSPSPSPSPTPSPTLAPTPSTPDPSGSPEPSGSAEPSGSLKPDATPSSGVPTASPDASDDDR